MRMGLFLGAIVKGLTGGYVVFSLGLLLMIHDKRDDPAALAPLFAQLRSLSAIAGQQALAAPDEVWRRAPAAPRAPAPEIALNGLDRLRATDRATSN